MTMPTSKPGVARSAAIALLACLVLAACGGPKTRYYAVRMVKRAGSPAPPLTAMSAAVERFRGDRVYDQERIIYRDENNEVGFYEYHRWLSSPVDLTMRSVMGELAGAGYFRSVALYRDDPQADYLLRGQVLNFEEVDKAAGVFAVVRLEMSLIDNRRRTQLWSCAGEAELAVDVRSVPGVAQALDAALAESAREAVLSLGEYLKQNR